MPNFDSYLHIAGLVVAGFLAYIGMMIKSTVQKVDSKLDTHVATDDMKHEQIDGHLEATDNRVDRLENKVYFHKS